MKNLITPSEARANLYKLIEDVSSTHSPIVIAGRRHRAVLVAQDDWDAIQETLYLVSIPGMRDSIKQGLESSIEECDEELDW